MADAEVIISPEVDRSDLNKMNKQFSASFKKVAQDAEQQITKAISGGIKKGAKLGGKFLSRAGGAARSGVDSLGGARGIATGVGGIALAGLISRIDRAGQGGDLLQGILGESTAAGTLSGSTAAGFSPAQLGQFSAQIRANAGGPIDQAEINDLLQDINVRVQESVAEGGGQLQQFGHLQGQERINSVLVALSQISPAAAQQQLDAMGISGEAFRALSPLVDATRAGGGSFEERLEFLNTSKKSEGQTIGENLLREAKLAKEYQDKQIAFNMEMRTKLLDRIDSGVIDSAIESQKLAGDKQLLLMENFVENNKTANDAREILNTTMGAMDATMTKVLEVVTGIGVMIGVAVQDQPKAAVYKGLVDRSNAPDENTFSRGGSGSRGGK